MRQPSASCRPPPNIPAPKCFTFRLLKRRCHPGELLTVEAPADHQHGVRLAHALGPRAAGIVRVVVRHRAAAHGRRDEGKPERHESAERCPSSAPRRAFAKQNDRPLRAGEEGGDAFDGVGGRVGGGDVRQARAQPHLLCDAPRRSVAREVEVCDGRNSGSAGSR